MIESFKKCDSLYKAGAYKDMDEQTISNIIDSLESKHMMLEEMMTFKQSDYCLGVIEKMKSLLRKKKNA